MLFNAYELQAYLNPTTVRGVIHIGAHWCEEKGYYNHFLRVPDDKIVWIEGNPEAAAEAIRRHPTAQVLTALCGNKSNQTVDFMITSNGESSSLLPFGTHLHHHPQVQATKFIEATTTTLDELLAISTQQTIPYNLINIDVQGAEKIVLEGATNVLPFIDYIYAEVNEEELYKGCSLLPEFDAFLATHGFRRVMTKMTEYKWGDALYVKDKNIS